ncbi:LOG family protein [Nocardioides sp. zg-578]|uniref:TIGR00725 family protein n=2 Tax=Nocardioides marmotae TaxID=2663857 RepID=A0A6I3JF39_9ACTN|nr:LOG family protein [Nocardioides marmotae]MCR6033211.1 TIGR00725 family protein [Gordonia jinghuaiqii]MTB83834.1 TIGR00725 family protein [Nocardioides marmotae]MTB96866.1 TIGR00725 family protein [Nocardioides marmotae]QKE03678.1 TIGR00725 family protein [Nocardioides marmotae]
MDAAGHGRYVAVVGPADSATAGQLAAATEVGRLLAEAGAVVLTGGLHGVMRAAATGARDAGGTAIGLLPGRDRAAGSPEHTFLLPTGLGELRNGLLVRAADAVVAVGGSWGTLSEIALARRTGVPLVLLDPWDLPDDVGTVVGSPAEALTALGRALGA